MRREPTAVKTVTCLALSRRKSPWPAEQNTAFFRFVPVLAPGAVFIPGDTEDDVLQMVRRPVPEEEDILGVVQKE